MKIFSKSNIVMVFCCVVLCCVVLNSHFSQFPNFIKMQQPTCDCEKKKINVSTSDMPSSELSTNHFVIKRNSCVLS